MLASRKPERIVGQPLSSITRNLKRDESCLSVIAARVKQRHHCAGRYHTPASPRNNLRYKLGVSGVFECGGLVFLSLEGPALYR
jgi:hypothetical protein